MEALKHLEVLHNANINHEWMRVDGVCILSPPALCPPASSVQHPGPVRAGAATEDPGVLLWQYPLHEVLLQDSGALLQRSVLSFYTGQCFSFYVKKNKKIKGSLSFVLVVRVGVNFNLGSKLKFQFHITPCGAMLNVPVLFVFSPPSWRVEWGGHSEVVQRHSHHQRERCLCRADEEVCWVAAKCRRR